MNEFWQFLGGEGEIAPANADDAAVTTAPKRLLRLSDSSGRVEFKEEKTGGKVRKSNFDSNDGMKFSILDISIK